MGKAVLSSEKIKKIVELRQTGHSLGEIYRITGNGRTTIFKYIKDVKILPAYIDLWKQKRGGSKYKAMLDWNAAREQSQKMIPGISQKEKLLILSCLYWGEGNKNELSLINSDPALIKVFTESLALLGVPKEQMKFTLRIFEDMNKEKVIRYWSKVLNIHYAKITGVNILVGKKKGKLENGMCRVRVKKGARYFKLIMSMIDLIKLDFNAAVVQRIERETPKL